MIAVTTCQSIAGFLSVAGGLYMFWGAWKRRDQIFHRLVLAISIYTVLFGVLNVWGIAAVPKGTPGVHGARGNTTTCTIQGFLLNTSGMVISLYYVFLSIHSWAVIMHSKEFLSNPERYRWIENSIHVGVHLFPLASSVYLAVVEAFNPIGFKCWVASYPPGNSNIDNIAIGECERGPQNPGGVLWNFAILPTMMPYIPLQALIQQAVAYLGLIYWIHLPRFLFFSMTQRNDNNNNNSSNENRSFSFFVDLWQAGETTGDTEPVRNSISVDDVLPTKNGDHTDAAKQQQQQKQKQKLQSIARVSFNIFDGTNSSDAFRDFIFDGDSDDEENDMHESKYWSGCQKTHRSKES
eukprot:jgi/Psemu1/265082/estExt_Genewise1Plus.C_32760001